MAEHLEAGGTREAGAALQASRRALRVLAGTGEALVRARDEVSLFQEVCRVAVVEGGFRMAWAGVAEQGEGKPIRPVAWHGHEAGYLTEARLTWADEERGRGTAGIAMRSGRVAVANDLSTDPRFAPWLESARARGYASNAVLPLVHRGEPLGILGFFSQDREAFTPEVIEVLQRIADDLAFGLVVLRARARADAQAAQLEAAVEFAGLGLWSVDLSTGRVEGSAALRRMAGFAPGEPCDLGEHWLARVHPDDLPGVQRRFQAAQAARPPGSGPAAGAWRFRYVRPDGTVCWVDSRSRILFDEAGRPRTLVGVNLDVTAEVLEHERLRALTARIQQVREEEKTRLARDLHDDLGQALTALLLELRGAEAIGEALPDAELSGRLLDRLVAASALAADTIASVQRLSWSLRSEALERLGLDAALRQELRLFTRRTGLEVEEALAPPGPVAAAVATAAFRIAQEALTNVARHAAARRVWARLAAADGWLELEIADDGRGLPPAGPGAVHLGLLGMQERAREFGGAVEVTSRGGGGTVVRARIPCQPGGAP